MLNRFPASVRPSAARSFAGLSIRRKLLLNAVLPLLLFGVFALWLWAGLGDMQHRVSAQVTANVRFALMAKDLQRNVVQVQQFLTDVSATRGQNGLDDGFRLAAENRDQFLDTLTGFRTYLKAQGALAELRALESVSADFETYYTAGVAMARAYVAGGPGQGNTLMPAFDQASATLQEGLDAFVRSEISKMESDVASVSDEANSIKHLAFALCLGVGVLVLVLSVLILRSTNEVLRAVVSDMDSSARQTAAAARQVSVASQMLSSGASEQAAAVEETGTSLEEIAGRVRVTADNARRAKELAAQARSVAEDGNRFMSDMRTAMSAIDASSAEVAKIVKSIDEIAFQTNILSLNAAVEAARAGESGAGFAVVADEVRSLAQRSAAAARETAGKIDAAIANSRRGAQCTAQMGEALRQIIDKITATDALVGDIAGAAIEQSQGIGQVGVAVSQMERIAHGNASSADQSAAAAEEFDLQAEMMKTLVNRLRMLLGSAVPVAGASTLKGPAPFE
jgi:methyl-accepting chemotaxis protein